MDGHSLLLGPLVTFLSLGILELPFTLKELQGSLSGADSSALAQVGAGLDPLHGLNGQATEGGEPGHQGAPGSQLRLQGQALSSATSGHLIPYASNVVNCPASKF